LVRIARYRSLAPYSRRALRIVPSRRIVNPRPSIPGRQSQAIQSKANAPDNPFRFLILCSMPSAPPTHEEGLRHQLTAGQMAMVAVGGSIGTGLLLGSGAAMEVAG